MTLRLYWDDPLLLSFEARVVAHSRLGQREAFVLERTAFYPEAGGQLADRGQAAWDGGGAAIEDAQEDEAGRVLHALAPGAPLPPLGADVRVTIDEARRRQHMSQHTGQHMLSRALLDVAGAPTVSSRLGDDGCTIDTSLERIADEALAEAEALVARVVLEDRPVRQLRPDAEELARLPLRREPKVTSNVRVIEIEGFDLSPCGGTHCVRTGQVGPVRITNVERYKGGLRITFLAGLQAAADDAVRSRAMGALARELTCGVGEVPALVARMKADAKERVRELGALRVRLAKYLAAELVAAAAGPVVAAVLTEPVELVRTVSAEVAARGKVALVAARDAEAVRLVFTRPAGSPVDVGAILKRVAAACGGRGGGRPDRAEGSVPATAAIDAALAAEQAALS